MDNEVLLSELKFKAVRSSGAGGQNVNKVSSKVVLNFDLLNSSGLTQEEKELLQVKIATKLTQESVLIIASEEDRSQLKNKEIAVKKFLKVIESGLKVAKVRKETKVSKAAKEKRLSTKKVIGLLKQNRKKPNF